MTFDAVVFVLTLWRTLHIPRLGSRSRLDVFIRDDVLIARRLSTTGVLYFGLMTCVNAANITIFLVCNTVCPLWSRFDLPVYRYGLLPHISHQRNRSLQGSPTLYPQLWFLA
ncbi:hypothetical protein EDC04DRAFT_2765916 [Pisolithus marmoratus]|nr:hypothetical protein EDC04DRAFT_2765916 [Pisolithus marmoratus]